MSFATDHTDAAEGSQLFEGSPAPFGRASSFDNLGAEAFPSLSEAIPGDLEIVVVNGKKGFKKGDAGFLVVSRHPRSVPGTVDLDALKMQATDALYKATVMQADGGHSFQLAEDGSYTVKMVAMNTKYEFATLGVPLFRPMHQGGHVMCKTAENIERVLKVIRDDLSAQQAGRTDVSIALFKFTGKDVLFACPTTHIVPELLHMLGLERTADGITGINTRLCDGKGLGRSVPHIAGVKFKFLFPNVEVDTSMLSAAKKKKKRARTADASEDGNANPGVLLALTEVLRAGSGGSVKDRVRAVLLRNFLEAYKAAFGDEVFDATFGTYASMSPPVVASIFGNSRFLRETINQQQEVGDTDEDEAGPSAAAEVEVAIDMIESVA